MNLSDDPIQLIFCLSRDLTLNPLTSSLPCLCSVHVHPWQWKSCQNGTIWLAWSLCSGKEEENKLAWLPIPARRLLEKEKTERKEKKKDIVKVAFFFFYLFSFSFIPATKDRVCCCQHRASWVQCCGDTSLQELIRSHLKSTVNQKKAMLSSGPLKRTMLSKKFTLAIEIVCCSIASWIATRSSSRICKMPQTKW